MGKILLCAAMLVSQQASAMRCGQLLVEIGDLQEDEIEKCGQPYSVHSHGSVRGSRLGVDSPLELDQFEEVQIEEWIYHFGPHRLREALHFENGVLKKIQALPHQI